jgi:hypothetical protein
MTIDIGAAGNTQMLLSVSLRLHDSCLGCHNKGPVMHANVTVLYSWCRPTRCGEPAQCSPQWAGLGR